MSKQDTKELSPIEAFVGDVIAYSSNAVRIAALKEEQAGLVSANGELRKAIVPFFKEHQGDKWSSLSKPIKAAIIAAKVNDVDGLLGVLKTSFEYKVLPTQQNADRFRKLETWVSWSGVVVPNTYGKVHKEKEPAPATAPTATAPTATAPTATAPTATAPTATKAPSKATTSQKPAEAIHPLTSNVSSSDTPISPREHCGILLDQLFKNESFRGEFAPILAMCLDSNVATVTRCLVEARDVLLNGKGGK